MKYNRLEQGAVEDSTALWWKPWRPSAQLSMLCFTEDLAYTGRVWAGYIDIVKLFTSLEMQPVLGSNSSSVRGTLCTPLPSTWRAEVTGVEWQQTLFNKHLDQLIQSLSFMHLVALCTVLALHLWLEDLEAFCKYLTVSQHPWEVGKNSLFKRWGNWGTERVRDMPKLAQQGSSQSGKRIQVLPPSAMF